MQQQKTFKNKLGHHRGTGNEPVKLFRGMLWRNSNFTSRMSNHPDRHELPQDSTIFAHSRRPCACVHVCSIRASTQQECVQRYAVNIGS